MFDLLGGLFTRLKPGVNERLRFDELGGGLSGGEVVEHNRFVTGGLAADDFDLAAGMVQGFGKEFNQGLIGSGINWRRCHLHFQFVTQWFADFVAGGAGLEFDRKQSAAGGFAEEIRRRHEGNDSVVGEFGGALYPAA